MEHLLNCHGEWFYVLTLLGFIPFVGPWLKARVHRLIRHTDNAANEREIEHG